MPLNIDWQQILLHMFNFALLFTVFYLLLYKPVKKFMDNRKKYYEDLEAQTDKNLSESKKTKEEYEKLLENAEAEIRELKSKAQKDADVMSEKLVSDAKDEASRIISVAKEDGKREQARLLAGAGNQISDMVTAATAKIVFSDSNSAYEDFLKEVEGSDIDGQK